jgi:galactofuranose transport system substrate-binding protein
MKKILVILLALVLVVGMFAGCQPTVEAPVEEAEAPAEAAAEEAPAAVAEGWVWPAPEELHVGFSQADMANSWRTAESDHMEEIAAERGFKITITNANGDQQQQITDVESLLAQGCNVIVIVSIDADGSLPALLKCKEAGVPTILKARGSNGVPGVDYTSFAASDFIYEGEQAGKYIFDSVSAKGVDKVRVVVLQGIIGGTDVRDRGIGFVNAAEDYGNYEVVAEQTANWSRSEAQDVMQNIIQATSGEFDAVYAMNDEMALGAELALRANGMVSGFGDDEIIVVGIDGLAEALDAVRDGLIACSVTCTPKYADLVFDIIEKGMAGEELEVFYQVPDVVIDAENVEEFYHLGF